MNQWIVLATKIVEPEQNQKLHKCLVGIAAPGNPSIQEAEEEGTPKASWLVILAILRGL